MAGNRIDVTLSVNDDSGSLKKRNDEAKELNKTLTKAAQLSERAMKPAARREKDQPAGENIEYGRGRGSMGATGASARDFANEAQGLGGLVRLYATYAANLFAVSAAFNSLREAMNTTNMVQGLNQLGAASGVALGGLAKQFVEVTGGAISLRESMEATTKAVSSGLTQKQLLQIGEVAKKASQSLGINMSDAVSRLTRGITKLEPELLDELGLFTKTGMAAEAYARSVGKSASALTDFERRQAFANAVLEEGRQKFSEIDIPTNPYDKLLSSLRNVAQQILEVINKGLVPLIDYLSQSPTALTGLIVGLGTMILRQALPIFSSYRKAMAEATQEAAAQARARMETARKALEIARSQKAEEAKILTEGLAEQRTLRVNAEVDTLKALTKGRLSKEVKGIVSEKKGVLDITEADLKVLDTYGAKNTKIAQQYRDLAKAIREAQEAERRYLDQVKEIERRRDAAPPTFSRANVSAIDLERARKQEAGATLVSKVSETAGTVGSLAAIKELISGIKTEKLGVLQGGLTALSGAATIAATAIGGLMTIASTLFGYFATAAVIFEALNYAFSTNSKELDTLSNSFSNSEESIKAAEATAKKYYDTLQPQAIIASATALNNLSDSLKDTTDALIAAERASSGWDKFIDAFKVLYGGNLQAQFGENFARQVQASLKSITDPQLKKDAESKLRELFKVQDLSAESIQRGINMLRPEQVTQVAAEVTTLFTGIARQAKTAGDALSAVGEGFKNLQTSYQELANQLVANDPLSKFGTSLAQQGLMLADVFKDPINAAAQLRDILNDASKIRLLSPESQKLLVENRDRFNQLSASLKSYEEQIVKTQQNIKYYGSINMYDEMMQEQSKLTRQQQAAQDTRQQMIDMAKSMGSVVASSIKLGFELIEVSFTRTVALGIVNAQKALVDKLPRTEGTIKLGADLEMQKIDLQIEEIKVTERLIKEFELGRLQQERLNIERQRDLDLQTVTSGSARDAIRQEAARRIEPITARETLLKSPNIAADIKKGTIERNRDSLQEMTRQLGTFAKLQALNDQKRIVILNKEIDLQTVKIDQERIGYQQALDFNTKSLEAFKKSDEFRAMELADQQTLEMGYATTNRILQEALATAEARKQVAAIEAVIQTAERENWKDITDLAKSDLLLVNERLRLQQAGLDTERKGLETDRDRNNQQALRAVIFERENIARERGVELQKTSSTLELDLLDIQKQVLDQQLSQRVITQDAYAQQLRAIEATIAAKQQEARVQDILNKYIASAVPLMEEYSKATGTQKETIERRLEALTAGRDAELAAIRAVFTAQESLRTSQENFIQRQIEYGKIFENTFSNMADALLEFVNTGKLNFKSLINSMIQDLIRFELKQQAMLFYQAARPGLMNLVSNIFGSGNPIGPGGASDPATFNALMTLTGGTGLAKGGAFESGIMKYAKGGMFTNSVVSEPTLFKFAKGTGLMGEAGPEAIMPLRRDGDGNLGVMATQQGTNVEVVVNNFSSEKAEARETVDSRGNRKIEVIVGEMVAGELGRKNSPVQQSMMTNFMAKPATVRR